MTTCRSCGANVIWVSLPSRKRLLVNAAPDPAGNVLLSTVRQRGMVCGHVLTAGDISVANEAQRYRPHWATCPDAAMWRKSSAKAQEQRKP